MANDHGPLQCLRQKAATQHGLFTRDDAEQCGVSRRQLERRLSTREWERLRRGVFRIVGHPSVFEQDALAAALFNGDGAVASHRTAARLWGLPGFGRELAVEVTKARGRSQRKPYSRVHGSLVLPGSHVTVHDHIPITDPARTIFDLTGTIHRGRAERALDNAIAMRLVTIGRMEVVFADLARRGRRGTALMRDLLVVRGEGYSAPTSELEALGRSVLREAGLPEPDVECNLGDGDWIGRVDLAYPDVKLVIELDSRRHHTSFLDRSSDRRRDNRLMAAGWRVLRFTWWDLIQRPNDVTAQIWLALAVAA